MFGGLAFLLDGKMFIGVANRDLMVRVGADAYDAALARPHVRPMDFTGRPLTGLSSSGPPVLEPTIASPRGFVRRSNSSPACLRDRRSRSRHRRDPSAGHDKTRTHVQNVPARRL
jgi:hypothetical protein